MHFCRRKLFVHLGPRLGMLGIGLAAASMVAIAAGCNRAQVAGRDGAAADSGGGLGDAATCVGDAGTCSDRESPRDAGGRDAASGEGTAVGDRGRHADAGVVYLSNADDSCEAQLLIPSVGEEGALAAARLTPPAYPFTVLGVSYRLGHGAAGEVTCDASLAHRVLVFAGTDVVPAAEPLAPLALTVPAVDPARIPEEGGRVVEQDLAGPLVLQGDEQLFVAVELAGKHPRVMCLPANSEAPYEGNRNYWSTPSTPPYDWVQLDTFGLRGSVLISACGRRGGF